MPLQPASYKKFYEDFFTSDDVIDEIVYGRKEYPVIDLCISHEFDLVYVLLQKGYRCLHEDKTHEVSIILRSVRSVRLTKTTGAELIPSILNALSDELEQLSETEYRTLVNELGLDIANERYYKSNATILSYIRENLPGLYTAFIKLGGFPPSTLMMLDTDFVEKQLDELYASQRLDEYSAANQVDGFEATNLLLKLMSVDSFDAIDRSLKSLYRIHARCPEIFPKHFTCDAAILSIILKSRDAVKNLDETDLQPDHEYFSYDSFFYSQVGLLNRLLHSHMQNDYSFDCVAEALILSCKADRQEYPYKDIEIARSCDFYILENVTKFAKGFFHIDKLPISKATLENVKTTWMNMNRNCQNEDWKTEYDLTFSRINELIKWFYDNCEIAE